MTPNAAIQALMQAAVDPVDQWTLDNLAMLPQWNARWEFQNRLADPMPCDWDHFCEGMVAAGHQMRTLTAIHSVVGVDYAMCNDEDCRSLTKLFGQPYMVTERWYCSQLAWRVTDPEQVIYNRRWMSQEPFFKQWREAKIQKERAVANHG